MNTVLTRETQSQSPPVEAVEAVIISGPRKGAIVTLGDADADRLTREEEAALDVALEAMQRTAQSARETVETVQALNQKLDQIHGRLHDGCVGDDSRNGQVSDYNRSAVKAAA